MKLFSRKQKVIMRSEGQKEAFIQKLEDANIPYDVEEDLESIYAKHVTYIIRVNAADLKKVS